MSDFGLEDFESVEPQGTYELLPVGKYIAVISGTEKKTASTGNGDYLSLKVQILDGPHAKRVLFDNLNLWHSKPDTKEMAKRRLKMICLALGMPKDYTPQKFSEITGKPIVIALGVTNDPTYGQQNTIKAYEAYTQGVAPVTTTAPASSAPGAPAATLPNGEKPPWE